jgi:hypothetical protein
VVQVCSRYSKAHIVMKETVLPLFPSPRHDGYRTPNAIDDDDDDASSSYLQ